MQLSPNTKWRPKRLYRRTGRWLQVLWPLLGVLALLLWWLRLPSADLDIRTQAMPIALGTLREFGEDIAAKYPGARNMGQLVHPKNAYKPLDRQRVVQSCHGTGRQDGRAGMVVLVTGSGGFIGMSAALALRARGDGVLGIDNFNDYYPVSLKRARQAHLESAGVYTAEGDINDADLLRSLFAACRFTHVLHLAAQAGVRYATKNPQSYVHANLAGQVNLLEVIKDQKPMPMVVYASSSSVYGLNKKQPFSEEDRVDQPASLYAATKASGELIAHVYHNIHGLSLTGLRFFTVYGPWARPDMAAYKFAVSIMKGEAIPIFQGPNGTELSRDFTYIDDIVRGVVAALDSAKPSVKGRSPFRLYNLGNTHPHTVSEMVGLLEGYLGRQAIRHYIPMPPTGDVLATFADISAARRDLAYQPQVSLEVGMKRFAEWFFEYYGPAADDGAKLAADWSYKPV